MTDIFTPFEKQNNSSSDSVGGGSINYNGPTQNWNGQQIPADIPTKNLVAYDSNTGNRTFKLPDFVGGGVYTEDANKNLVLEGHTTYGGVQPQPGMQRDDIIPAGLGGANSQAGNIQMMPDAIAHQQDKVESQLSRQVKSGQLPPKATIPLALREKQQISGQAPSENLGNPLDIGAGLINTFGGAGGGDINAAMGERNPLKAGGKFALGLGKAVGSAAAFIPEGIYNLLKDIATGDFAKQIDQAYKEGAGRNKTIFDKAGGMAQGFLTGLTRTAPLLGAAEASMELPKGGTVKSSANVARNAISNPYTKEEQELAVKQGRTTLQKGKPVIAPTSRETNMQKALQPLVDEGKITAKTDKITGLIKGEEQLRNILNTSNESKNTGIQLRNGLKELDKQDIANGKIQFNNKGQITQGVWKPADLFKQIWNTEEPLSIKSTERTQANLDNSVFTLISDAPKTREGLLDLRQNFDNLVKKDYPNLYEKDMTPTRNYIQNLRETINDFTNQQLPEGKSGGLDFRQSLLKQHNLLNAQDEMAQKFTREYPQGSTNFSRMMKAHPMAARMLNQTIRYGLLFGGAYAVIKTLEKPAVTAITKFLGGGPKPKPIKAPSPKSNKIRRL